MQASRVSPVRQNRTKRKMSAYSSDLERFVERTTPINYGRFISTLIPSIMRPSQPLLPGGALSRNHCSLALWGYAINPKLVLLC